LFVINNGDLLNGFYVRKQLLR